MDTATTARTLECTPRSHMPQVNFEDYQDLFTFIGGRGLTAEFRNVHPDLCKPSQCMDPFDPKRTSVNFAMQRPVLLSRDLHILDGHHRWQAVRMAGFSRLPSYVLGQPLERVLPVLCDFPKSYRCEDC